MDFKCESMNTKVECPVQITLCYRIYCMWQHEHTWRTQGTAKTVKVVGSFNASDFRNLIFVPLELIAGYAMGKLPRRCLHTRTAKSVNSEWTACHSRKTRSMRSPRACNEEKGTAPWQNEQGRYSASKAPHQKDLWTTPGPWGKTTYGPRHEQWECPALQSVQWLGWSILSRYAQVHKGQVLTPHLATEASLP